MSAEAAHADPHHPHASGASHGTRKSYLTGFVLSVVLTAIPFWLVMAHVFHDPRVTAFAVMGFAFVQIVVHMIYFLHMSTKSENGWTMMALIFTIVLVVITLTGSMWVMYNLNSNMMPMSAHDMRDMP
jgi:cytochrome o ubiquinol oxidase operon protein cyoD